MSNTRISVINCVVFLLLQISGSDSTRSIKRVHHVSQFSSYTTVRPQLVHGRDKRDISSTKDNVDGGHIHKVTVTFDAKGKHYILDLQLNRELVPDSYSEKYQSNGKYVVTKPTQKDVELCHYQGKVRGVPNSWVAVSTCNGISGVIYDGQDTLYLERGSNEDDVDAHFLYNHSDITSNGTCGYQDNHSHIGRKDKVEKRIRREVETFHGPYNANKKSRYVELVLVVDNRLYRELENDNKSVSEFCQKIVNIVNAIYTPLNIFIALVGVVVWTERDEIDISSDGDATLSNFLRYRRQKLLKEYPNDNAQLLTLQTFNMGVLGKALIGPICTFEYSGAVASITSNIHALIAITVAHEMGHNFGMVHDRPDCSCSHATCLMSSSYLVKNHSMEWSSCSRQSLLVAFDHGMDYCLRNKPTSLFSGPVCGNGFIEAGEQCDCGLEEHCDSPCCNATTCMLYSYASCATGECCDLEMCQLKEAGSLCRSADYECDLPEYCTGQSEYCPIDVYKIDGLECKNGEAFCYQGSCRTQLDQCRLLWGPSGKGTPDACYQLNMKGTRFGNCGYNVFNQTYVKCADEDIKCGRLLCNHLNDRLEFGMESASILSHAFINFNGSIVKCVAAAVDLGASDVDRGLVPNGAKCGDGKMCLNQHCVNATTVSKCPQNCSGNGVCNSLGHCHCNPGFASPYCDQFGTGGSVDSGPVPLQINDSNINNGTQDVIDEEDKTTEVISKEDQDSESTSKVNDNIKMTVNNELRAIIQEFRTAVEVAVKKLLVNVQEKISALLSKDQSANM